MSVVIRLQITGKRDKHHYKIQVSEKRSKKDSDATVIGYVNTDTNPPKIHVDRVRLKYFLDHGANVSKTVKKLLSL